MLHSTNIRMLQKHSKVATFEGSFKSNTFIYALLLCTLFKKLKLLKAFKNKLCDTRRRGYRFEQVQS